MWRDDWFIIHPPLPLSSSQTFWFFFWGGALILFFTCLLLLHNDDDMGDDDDEREREKKKFSKHLSCRHRLSVKFLFSKNFWRQPTRRQLIEKFITFWFHFLCKFFFRAIYETNWRYYPKRYSFDGPIYANDWPFSFTFSWFDENQLNRKRWRDNRRLIGSINFFWMTIFGALFSRKIVFIMQLLFKTFPKRKIQNKNETNRLTLCLSFKKYESYSLGTGVQCHVYSPCVFSCKCCLEERKKSCETVTIVAHQTKHFQVQRTVIGEPAEGRKWWFLHFATEKTHGTIGRACRERHGYLNYIFNLMRFHFIFFKLQTERRSLSVFFPPSKKLEKCVHFARSSGGLDV